MKKFKIAALLMTSLLAWGTGQAQAAAFTDTVEATTAFFVPTSAQRTLSPYYRKFGEDWGWTHGAIGGAFTSASLNISAYDVDAVSLTTRKPEVDKIYALDSGVWKYLGSLAGSNDTWAFSNFVLGANFYDDINAGLQVRMEIDTLQGQWLVSLGKSSLSMDGGSLPTPVPGIPEPETYALMLLGLAAMSAVARRRRRN